MANLVIMPRQGQSVESCIITAWHKKKGDKVAEGDIIYSYETDKSAFDEPSLYSGTILEVFAAEGDVVPCLDPVCIIGEEGEDISALIPGGAAEEAAPEVKAEEKKEEVVAAPVATGEVVKGERVKISPRAKALSLKTGVDMTKVVPTGPHGRIIERDINLALDAGYRASSAAVEAFLRGEAVEVPEEAPEAVAPAAPVAAAAVNFAECEEVPMSGVRRAISRSMHASLSEMAQLTLNASFDATKLMAYRASLKAGAEALGLPKISLNDMVFFAVSRTLLKHPDVNATLKDDVIRKYKHANIGLAVDTERGLLVPTIFGADTLSLAEISKANKEAAGKAREGTLTPDEMSGGTFTITNLGSLGIESFTPVINPPQVAILGVCAITQRLKADGSVYSAMGLSLTFDHRAIDGAPAARFLKDLATALENFDILLAQ
ncbi:MAG: 2-oxo acid dehydrogenase subunit E2 [Ruminococcaceae bacterium]|nr:2-oxo acid dehydrogenase subunit E2 [Oscillospiraceae bacterium]